LKNFKVQTFENMFLKQFDMKFVVLLELQMI